MAKRGKKDCENCNTEIGARSLLCNKCGYHYPSGKVRQDLLEESLKPKEAAIYTKGGRGRKTCPKCEVIVGAVTKTCPKCSFDFTTIVKVKIKKKQKADGEPKKEGPSRAEIIVRREFEESKGKAPTNCESLNCYTSKDHAERILGYGKERATMLFKLHKWGHSWPHIDWNIVEAGIAA